MPTALITGGAGYIGSHTALAFQEAGWNIVVVDDLSTGHAHLVPAEATFYKENVGNTSAMEAIIIKHRPDAVVHFAGSIIVSESVSNPGKYYENNTAVTLRLGQVCAAAGIKALIFSSTAAVYGEPAVVPVHEDAPLLPINPYGRSKLASEFILRDLALAHGFALGILRYFNVAGADPAGRTGQATPEATHLIKIACEVAVGKRPAMTIFGNDYPTPDGTCIRDYIHVSDLAAAHIVLANALLEEKTIRLHNCGYGQGFSVNEVVETVRQVSGHPVPATIGPRRAGDPARLISDPGTLLTTTAWQPKFNDLNFIVRTALAWERTTLA
ncbi:MAG: UDP-glucose 4-epimerase GalE [Holosporales bacterium]